MNVIGLTTAACIWVVSGVGLAVGAGYYIIAVFASLLVYIILEILSQMDSWLVPTDNIMIKIRMINDSEKIKEVYNALLKLGLKIKRIRNDKILNPFFYYVYII
ncbi:MgtC/SapB family protein [Megamonas funiformis]|uniref:MgtC/SapB family protein n=1 Tax=Megamonas funiformis TaxID=437897 RepID=UPI00265D32DF|nr:MgtC/SapB family protein [Megamonas funiformis]